MTYYTPKIQKINKLVLCATAERNQTLRITITNFDGHVVKNVNVRVDNGLGAKKTNEQGIADFGKVKSCQYKITATKKEYSPTKGGKEAPAETTIKVRTNQSENIELKLHGAPVIIKENLILVGSERYYSSFWWKMMFIAPAYAMVKHNIKLQAADVTTIAYVKNEYTNHELLPFEYLKNTMNIKLKVIGGPDDVINIMKERPTKKVDDREHKNLLQDVAIFCHGFPGQLAFNYSKMGPDYDVEFRHFKTLKPDIFIPNGKIYSYACRTGISSDDGSFKNDAEAKPEESLAQQLADHFKVTVHAYLTRTLFRNIIREPNQSKHIASTLKSSRKTQNGKVIQIPPEHEGLPHPGLDYTFSRSQIKEGVNEYALWRKEGATKMPYAANTPKGLSKTMRQFKPR